MEPTYDPTDLMQARCERQLQALRTAYEALRDAKQEVAAIPDDLAAHLVQAEASAMFLAKAIQWMLSRMDVVLFAAAAKGTGKMTQEARATVGDYVPIWTSNMHDMLFDIPAAYY